MATYPFGQEKGATPLAHGRNYGIIKVAGVATYGNLEIVRARNIECFVDLEHPHGRTELHFGFVGDFGIQRKHAKNVSPRVDLYIPVSEITKLKAILLQLEAKMENEKHEKSLQDFQ